MKTLILYFLMLSIGLVFAQRPNSAIIPSHHLDRKGWRERHEQILEKVKSSDPKLIMIGNSTTHNLDLPDRKIFWEQYLSFLKRKARSITTTLDISS